MGSTLRAGAFVRGTMSWMGKGKNAAEVVFTIGEGANARELGRK
eukprot:gene12183-34452_t